MAWIITRLGRFACTETRANGEVVNFIEQGLSQEELAKKVGTISVTIGRYERDIIKPSIDIATKIADALEVSLDYLTGKTNIELDNAIIKRVVEI